MTPNTPQDLIGYRVRIGSTLTFLIASYDTRRRRYIMRNVESKKEHDIPFRELYGYLADPALHGRFTLLARGES